MKIPDILQPYLEERGLTLALDKTKSIDKNGFHFSRGEGILQYLADNKVEKYVILDDYQFDYDSCGLSDYYIKTDAYNGGLAEEIEKAEEKVQANKEATKGTTLIL